MSLLYALLMIGVALTVAVGGLNAVRGHRRELRVIGAALTIGALAAVWYMSGHCDPENWSLFGAPLC